MTKYFLTILFIALLIAVPYAYAQKASIKLLAVSEEAEQKGTVVELDLTIIEGSGNVFLDTKPLSQIDTQISLRIGKTIACQTSNTYCLNKDFFYSIKASSPVIAGPSAGAAITLVTMASLNNKKLDENAVITGTINSGGVIGVVGGVKEKIKAAADAGLKKVLIPRGEENATELIAFGNSLNLTVIEVADIEGAYEIFTGESRTYPELTVNRKYETIMKNLNEEICARTKEYLEKIEIVPEKYTTTYNAAVNLTKEAGTLFENAKYYSSASRCFGANVYLGEIILFAQNLSEYARLGTINSTKNEINMLELELNNTQITNLGNLEVLMIIRERLFDAKKNLEEARTTSSMRDLSYAIERKYSSYAWKRFLNFDGKSIDQTKLEESCSLKIEEVQELYNYISLYLPALLEESKKELKDAREYLRTEDYALCLFKASKSKAEIGAALSALYITEENLDVLFSNKLLAAEKAIKKQIQQGTFPILGYSYYEYATVLNSTEKYSALLYSEYGIELSNLNIYFPPKKPVGIEIDTRALIALIIGFAAGLTVFSFSRTGKRKKLTLKRH